MESKAFRLKKMETRESRKGIKQVSLSKKKKQGDPRMGEGGDPRTKFKKRESFYVGCFQHPQALTKLHKGKGVSLRRGVW